MKTMMLIAALVFAGGVARADEGSKGAPMGVDPMTQAQKDLADVDAEIAKTVQAIQSAATEADRKAAQAKLDKLKQKREIYKTKLDAIKLDQDAHKPAPPPDTRSADEKALADLDAKIAAEKDAKKKDALTKQRPALYVKVLTAKQTKLEAQIAASETALTANTKAVGAAVDAVAKAKTADERAAAKAKLEPLAAEKKALDAQLAELKAQGAMVARELGIAQSQQIQKK